MTTQAAPQMDGAEWRLIAALNLPRTDTTFEALAIYRARVHRDMVKGMAGWGEWLRIGREVIRMLESTEEESYVVAAAKELLDALGFPDHWDDDRPETPEVYRLFDIIAATESNKSA